MKEQYISLVTNVKLIAATVITIVGLITMIIAFDARYVHAEADTLYEDKQSSDIELNIQLVARTSLSSLLSYRQRQIERDIKYMEQKKIEQNKLSRADRIFLKELYNERKRVREDIRSYR